MKKVSILVPLYNSEKYIAETLDSCIKQTYENIEIIVVDDGSTDNSFNIALSYSKKYKNIKIYQQKNSGAQKARNLAFEKSTGKYIQYLDADDILSQDKIELQMQLIRIYGNENIYSCKFLTFQDSINNFIYQHKKVDKSFENSIEWLITSWSGGGMSIPAIWLTPRAILEESGLWNEDLKKNQDGEYFCRVILNSKKIIYSDKALAYYRRGIANSISTQMSKQAAESTLYSYELYERHTKEYWNIYPKLKKALAYNYLSFINHFYPNYKELIDKAEYNIKKLGFKCNDLYLPGILYKLSKFIGIYNALLLRHKFNNILNKIKKAKL